ncbi:MAG: ureidoglycolate lyase [Candidatus Obscuribacterales bacterium]|nr:ureidoglycolate lyase [Candidatus Obscuribacterales bacterium]
MTVPAAVIKCVPMERSAYEAYGDLISADESEAFRFANMGTAKRFNQLSDVINLRPNEARLNLCVFRCEAAHLPLEMKLLERHPYSTQVFIPMHQDAKFLVIVSLGANLPDLATLKAFVVTGAQGISYKPGVWHYPMTALEQPIDFSCLIWEDGSEFDCHVVNLDEPIAIQL